MTQSPKTESVTIRGGKNVGYPAKKPKKHPAPVIEKPEEQTTVTDPPPEKSIE